MPCGHLISSESMHFMLENFGNDNGKYIVECPGVKVNSTEE